MKIIIISGMVLCLLGCDNREKNGEASGASDGPYVAAQSQIEAGRYIIVTAGCNDCHTHGFLQDNSIPESEWLTGSPMGWQGPWGTTYARNLRLSVQNYSEEDWVKMAKTRNTMPPMSWFSLNNMSEKDLKAIYAYINSLGPKGGQVPNMVPPGQQPQTPFLSLMPQNMPQDSVQVNSSK